MNFPAPLDAARPYFLLLPNSMLVLHNDRNNEMCWLPKAKLIKTPNTTGVLCHELPKLALSLDLSHQFGPINGVCMFA